MKIVVETKDLSNYLDYEDEITTEDLTEMVLDKIIEESVKTITYPYNHILDEVINQVSENLIHNKDDIVNAIIDKAAENIERKKKLYNQIPKKKDFNELDKEWEEYFTKLMDKCIAKKFR